MSLNMLKVTRGIETIENCDFKCSKDSIDCNKFNILNPYQKTYNGLSVARFSLHSNLSVDPSFICKSGASIISATASVCI